MNKLSAYVLTNNSEQFLERILRALSKVAEEIVVVDSGSEDTTETIARSFKKVRFVYHAFESFRAQREFAAATCLHEMVLFLDSDEIPDEAFIEGVLRLKAKGFPEDAYKAERHWQVLGKNIHSIYPIVSPDRPIRLIRKSKVYFTRANRVHESPTGFDSHGFLPGKLLHITFQTRAELYRKLETYTDMAALDLLDRKKKIPFYKLLFSPIGAFCKWYFLRKGYRDGWLGLILGRFAFLYTYKKYRKARKMQSN